MHCLEATDLYVLANSLSWSCVQSCFLPNVASATGEETASFHSISPRSNWIQSTPIHGLRLFLCSASTAVSTLKSNDEKESVEALSQRAATLTAEKENRGLRSLHGSSEAYHETVIYHSAVSTLDQPPLLTQTAALFSDGSSVQKPGSFFTCQGQRNFPMRTRNVLANKKTGKLQELAQSVKSVSLLSGGYRVNSRKSLEIRSVNISYREVTGSIPQNLLRSGQ